MTVLTRFLVYFLLSFIHIHPGIHLESLSEAGSKIGQAKGSEGEKWATYKEKCEKKPQNDFYCYVLHKEKRNRKAMD